jgi:signal transduction histidine kinase
MLRAIRHSLYGRISLVYLLILVVLGGVLLGLAQRIFTRLVEEADQKLNRSLAVHLAEEFSPLLQGPMDEARVGELMHFQMVMNPRVEIYLLDAEGNVLAFFADPAKIRQPRVRLEPIRQFLSGEASLPILGDDPRNVGKTKPFSVTPIQIEGTRPGYLYVILSSEEYDSAVAMVQDSYISQVTVIGVAVLLGVTLLVGLLLFLFITRRFRAITEAVRRFEQGDLTPRVPVRTHDEIGQLGQAFNQMADRIATQMDELKRTDDLRRELVANVSHDLRSPLASIQGYVETILMKDVQLVPAERARYLGIIHTTATRLSHLVHELFELSKLDARQVQPQPELFSMAELVQDVVMKFRPQAEQQHITLNAVLPPQASPVKADIGLIERVLSNLLDNALRYTPEQGTVYVKLAPQADGVQVCVSDTGYGIPAEHLPLLTERFYRVDKSRDRASGGAGLGLAIAQRILDLHGSHLEIESTVNVGTTVSFALHTRNGQTG